ncbi:MAG: hypothetical protein ACM3MD_01745 [Betaproteobacteria bacterium]
MNMVTSGHWKDGVMDHERLFWDNNAFMKQIGHDLRIFCFWFPRAMTW